MEKDFCPCCKQATQYLLELDKGTAEIVFRMADFIGRKAINIVHPRKELESKGILTSNQVGNLSRARFHGLIAKVKGKAGNYCLTRKGFAFLRGERIDLIAVIRKTTKDEPAHTAGYTGGSITVDNLNKKWLPYWQGCGYEIREGAVVDKL